MLRWLILLLLAFGLIVPVVLLDQGSAWWQAPGPLTKPRIFVVAKGGTQVIARELAGAGIVVRPLWFTVAAKLTGESRGFKAGEYLFPAGVTPAMVADILDSGNVVIHRVVIPEGLTTTEALAVIDTAAALTGKIAAHPGEGDLLPSTYFYVYGDQRQALTDRMVRAMNETLTTLWADRAPGLPLDDVRQAVTLASIVEKETALPAERPLIAEVFYNRLRKGMKLQSDPTVIYALTGGKSTLGRSLTHDDMGLDSRYNTYVTAGLPPGPIANP